MEHSDILKRITILEMEVTHIKQEQSSIIIKLDKLDERLRKTEQYMWMATGCIVAVNVILKFIKLP